MIEESLNHFMKIWNNTFFQDELEMFRFLSMREFQRAVVDIRNTGTWRRIQRQVGKFLL